MMTDSSGNSIGYPASILKDVPYVPPSATEVVENSSPTSPTKATITSQPSYEPNEWDKREAVFPDKAPCADCCDCQFCCKGLIAGIPEIILGCFKS
ncbi:unnamed protein product [Caenorhabditis nigoni]